MDDLSFKKLVAQYQQQEITFSKLEQAISFIVYYFPASMYRIHDRDLLGDFYLYMIERLPKALLNYQAQEKTKFLTYLYLILRRHYVNFINSRSYKISFLEYTSDMSTYYSPDFGLIKIEEDFYEKLFEHFPQEDIVFLKLFCPDALTPQDCEYLSEILGLEKDRILDKICYLFESTALKELKNPNEIHLVSVKLIAEFLGLTPYQVSKKLNRLKKKFGKVKGILSGVFD